MMGFDKSKSSKVRKFSIMFISFLMTAQLIMLHLIEQKAETKRRSKMPENQLTGTNNKNGKEAKTRYSFGFTLRKKSST